MTIVATLIRHPAAPGDAAQGIDVRVRREPTGAVTFHYTLKAEMNRIRVPRPDVARRTDGLWRHTCFEAFIQVPGSRGYCELNFSPSGQWALYGLTGYREGMTAPDVAEPPAIAVRPFADRLEVDAVVWLPQSLQAIGAKLALTAVIEDDSGTLSYWALRHAPAQPDFHHPDGFVLELPL